MTAPSPQPSAAPMPQAVQAPMCPICGQANGCAVAASGRFDSPCWCRSAAFPPGLLARVPAELRGQACICAVCNAAFAAQAAAGRPAG